MRESRSKSPRASLLGSLEACSAYVRCAFLVWVVLCSLPCLFPGSACSMRRCCLAEWAQIAAFPYSVQIPCSFAALKPCWGWTSRCLMFQLLPRQGASKPGRFPPSTLSRTSGLRKYAYVSSNQPFDALYCIISSPYIWHISLLRPSARSGRGFH